MTSRHLFVVAFLNIATGMASAQSKPPEPAPSSPVARSHHERISGEFAYIGGEKEISARNTAIEQATDDMFFAIRGTARRRIRDSTPVAQRVRISFGDGKIFVVAAGDPPAVSPDNGSVVNHKGRDGSTVKLSQQITPDDRLTQTFVGEEGGQTVLFTVSPDGKTLSTVHVIKSSRLPKEIRYTLTYQRS